MQRDLVILAGGLSTRFQDLGDKPKCMLDVFDKPILHRLIDFFDSYGFNVCVSLGHLAEEVVSQSGRSLSEVTYKIENEPLGTGGALFFALRDIVSDDFIVTNGDTLNNYTQINDAFKLHKTEKRMITQIVTINSNQNEGRIFVKGDRVVANLESDFQPEKVPSSKDVKPFSSTGTYIINRNFFESFVKKYIGKAELSFEKTLLPDLTLQCLVNSFEIKSLNYDIGTVPRYKDFIRSNTKESIEEQYHL